MENEFSKKLKNKMDEYAHLVYKITKKFPKEEMYGSTSQLRRSALSVILNYIEGFARKRDAVKKNFWEISYGSLKESKYLLQFTLDEGYCDDKEYKEAFILADEIGAMLWHSIESIK
ncbi:MAG: S23 ribosomal protein [uncultured bacterium]|nr:MAG: S23 ribosomal protein [uncultured bacterium]KKP67391.1 MAG: S23 ribosomal protein [Candidatus Moranbacteria bacterium GW2011_GWE2_35_164]KKP67455.1 MAG: S23 ribosomal protein [Candidatus Moranbacteria bacterium GW2011_GWE1_35_17]KKP82793.1 MAG: S23 ribosomal protein [Candidatus Moranbacteria bacterium GW2011_GWF1_35_5]HBR79531.1 four helix bundle protein [Candidatus Moranbacteria bacterium]